MLGQDLAEVPPAEDQHVVEALAAATAAVLCLILPGLRHAESPAAASG